MFCPPLFLICINNLPWGIPGDIVIYTDDVDIWGTEPAVVKSALDHAKRWFIDWRLRLNDDKCAGVSFGNAPTHQFWNMRNAQIHNGEQHKIFGFWADKALSFSHHKWIVSELAVCILNMIGRKFSSIPIDFQVPCGTYTHPIIEVIVPQQYREWPKTSRAMRVSKGYIQRPVRYWQYRVSERPRTCFVALLCARTSISRSLADLNVQFGNQWENLGRANS